MKTMNRRIWIGFLIAAMLAIVGRIGSRKQQPAPPLGPVSGDQSAAPTTHHPLPPPPAKGMVVAQVATNGPNAVAQAYQSYRQGTVDKIDVMRAMWQSENDKKLVFYGKLLDQYGQPVADAKVVGSTMIIAGIDETRSRQYETTSDANGLFQFTEARGVKMGVFPSKTGYEFNRKYAKANWSEDYQPDPTNPVVFTMWKLQGAERMIKAETNFIRIHNNQESQIDLNRVEKVNTGGDLVVVLRCAPLDGPPYVNGKRNPFDWDLTIEIPNGGFVPIAEGEYPYQAPDDGYQKTLSFRMSRSDPKWISELHRSYYIQMDNGKRYGHINFWFMINTGQDGSFARMESHINPWGSRNLEYEKRYDPFRPTLRW